MSEIKELFQEIDSAIKANPSFTEGLKANYQFNLKEGDELGTYHLALQDDKSYADEGEIEKPDCTLNMKAEDFKKMVSGDLNGTQAFMSGRLKIKGNMGLALKLQSILASYNQAAN